MQRRSSALERTREHEGSAVVGETLTKTASISSSEIVFTRLFQYLEGASQYSW